MPTREEIIQQQAMEYEKKAAQEQLLMQGAMQSYEHDTPETAEYIREFSTDRMWKFDKKSGELIDGSIPKGPLKKFWAVNNANYVFGNVNKDWERRRLELYELEIEQVDALYEINMDLVEGNQQLIGEALTEKQEIMDIANQRIHSFMKKTRTKGGRERELMVTKSVIAGTVGGDDKKKAGNWLSNSIGNVLSK